LLRFQPSIDEVSKHSFYHHVTVRTEETYISYAPNPLLSTKPTQASKVNFKWLVGTIFSMETLVDDIGSFPLPPATSREQFESAYAIARRVISEGKDVKEDKFLIKNFYNIIVDSFKKKCQTGLDVINYPQHYDMHNQFAEVILKAMEKGTYEVDPKKAIIPEVYVINREAKELSEELGRKISLRICITGPMELYLKMVGKIVYRDILLMFAETVRRFAKNAMLDSKYVKTEVVSLDEPSFGFQEISAEKDTILDVMERAFDFAGVVKQIHLHSPSRITDMLEIKNLDVVSLEYAASPKSINAVSKKLLENANKQIRVGISRTDINNIIAELYEKGITKPNTEQLVENEEVIRKRFLLAKEKFGETMTFTGPDCGLGGWPTQEAAQLLLERTARAVKRA
jgi:5-methyltetrahydropteroyltriglutamate--homocysteine methyltransferase